MNNREKYKIPDCYSGPLRVEKPTSGKPPYEFYTYMDKTIILYDDGVCLESYCGISGRLIQNTWPYEI